MTPLELLALETLITDNGPAELLTVVRKAAGQAAEIARLRALLQLALRYMEHPDVLAVTGNMALPGETVNARLRTALTEIDNLLHGDLPATREAKAIARAALEAK